MFMDHTQTQRLAELDVHKDEHMNMLNTHTLNGWIVLMYKTIFKIFRTSYTTLWLKEKCRWIGPCCGL